MNYCIAFCFVMSVIGSDQFYAADIVPVEEGIPLEESQVGLLPVGEPIEPVAQPVVEPITEPIAQSDIEPVTEYVAQPEHESEPVEQPVEESDTIEALLNEPGTLSEADVIEVLDDTVSVKKSRWRVIHLVTSGIRQGIMGSIAIAAVVLGVKYRKDIDKAIDIIKQFGDIGKDVGPAIQAIKGGVEKLIKRVGRDIPIIQLRAGFLKKIAPMTNTGNLSTFLDALLCITTPVWDIASDIDDVLAAIDSALSPLVTHISTIVDDLAALNSKIKPAAHDMATIVNAMTVTVPASKESINDGLLAIKAYVEHQALCKANDTQTQRAVVKVSHDTVSMPTPPPPSFLAVPLSSSTNSRSQVQYTSDGITCTAQPAAESTEKEVLAVLKDIPTLVDDAVDVLKTFIGAVKDTIHEIKSAIPAVRTSINGIEGAVAAIKTAINNPTYAVAGDFTQGLMNIIYNSLGIMQDVVVPFKAIDSSVGDILASICRLLGSIPGVSTDAVAHASGIVGPEGILGIAQKLDTGLTSIRDIFKEPNSNF